MNIDIPALQVSQNQPQRVKKEPEVNIPRLNLGKKIKNAQSKAQNQIPNSYREPEKTLRSGYLGLGSYAKSTLEAPPKATRVINKQAGHYDSH